MEVHTSPSAPQVAMLLDGAHKNALPRDASNTMNTNFTSIWSGMLCV